MSEITTEGEYKAAMSRIDEIFDDEDHGDELSELVDKVIKWEVAHYPIDPPTCIVCGKEISAKPSDNYDYYCPECFLNNADKIIADNERSKGLYVK